MVGASELIITINITTAIVIINFITVIITVKCCLHKGKRWNLQAKGILVDLFDKVMLVCGLSGSTTTLPVMARCDYYNYNYCYGKVWLHWRNRQNQPRASFYNKHNRVTWKFIASTRRFWKLLTQAIQGAILLIPLICVTCRPPFFLFKRVRK